MRRIGEAPPGVLVINTCYLRGRIFFADMDSDRVLLRACRYEGGILRPDGSARLQVSALQRSSVSVCALGDRLLLFTAVERGSGSLSLISVGEGPLSPSSVEVQRLEGSPLPFSSNVYMGAISASAIFVTADNTSAAYSVSVDGARYTSRKVTLDGPSKRQLDCPALAVPGGGFLVCGGHPYTSQMVKVMPGSSSTWQAEVLGKMCWADRETTALAQLSERFVLAAAGFNGEFLGDIAIFDQETCDSSLVDIDGERFKPTSRIFVHRIGGDVVLLGGLRTDNAYAISLEALGNGIRDERIHKAFQEWLKAEGGAGGAGSLGSPSGLGARAGTGTGAASDVAATFAAAVASAAASSPPSKAPFFRFTPTAPAPPAGPAAAPAVSAPSPAFPAPSAVSASAAPAASAAPSAPETHLTDAEADKEILVLSTRLQLAQLKVQYLELEALQASAALGK